MSAGLFDHHEKFLAARAVDPVVASERGYSSTTLPGALQDLGFSRVVSQLVPGLLVPVRDVHGGVRYHLYRPDRPRVQERKGQPRQVKYETPARTRLVIDVPPRVANKIRDPAGPLWITEGPVKADAAVSAGLDCIATNGAWGWRGTSARGGKIALPDWDDVALNGRPVFLVPDSDVTTNPGVASAVGRLGWYLRSRDATVYLVPLPPGPGGTKQGLDDFLAREGGDIEGLLVLATDELPARPKPDDNTTVSGPHIPGTARGKPSDAPPMTMAEAEEVYARWLHDDDPVPTRACHAVYVANEKLDGDPVWLALVGGSGWGKTERIMALAGLHGIVLASSLKGEASLLSATPRKDWAAGAHGGLLRLIGDRGILVLKDFTSVLEMDRKERGRVLAALREIYDGHWDRNVGAEGGQTLTWDGKCGLLTGCTTAIDRAHGVMAEMGPRSLFLRLAPGDLGKVANAALDQMGQEDQMRAELAQATAGVLTHLPGAPHKVTGEVRARVIALASLASQARSPVHRDWGGQIELIGDAEAPTRIIKQLGKLWEACGLLGLPQAESWEVVSRCALDSIPKLRGAVIRHLADVSGASTADLWRALEHPRRTVFRALEDLAAHHVVDQAGEHWVLSERARSWMASKTVPEMWGSPHE
jgi:hypothetical protein